MPNTHVHAFIYLQMMLAGMMHADTKRGLLSHRKLLDVLTTPQMLQTWSGLLLHRLPKGSRREGIPALASML